MCATLAMLEVLDVVLDDVQSLPLDRHYELLGLDLDEVLEGGTDERELWAQADFEAFMPTPSTAERARILDELLREDDALRAGIYLEREQRARAAERHGRNAALAADGFEFSVEITEHTSEIWGTGYEWICSCGSRSPRVWTHDQEPGTPFTPSYLIEQRRVVERYTAEELFKIVDDRIDAHLHRPPKDWQPGLSYATWAARKRQLEEAFQTAAERTRRIQVQAQQEIAKIRALARQDVEKTWNQYDACDQSAAPTPAKVKKP